MAKRKTKQVARKRTSPAPKKAVKVTNKQFTLEDIEGVKNAYWQKGYSDRDAEIRNHQMFKETNGVPTASILKKEDAKQMTGMEILCGRIRENIRLINHQSDNILKSYTLVCKQFNPNEGQKIEEIHKERQNIIERSKDSDSNESIWQLTGVVQDISASLIIMTELLLQLNSEVF